MSSRGGATGRRPRWRSAAVLGVVSVLVWVLTLPPFESVTGSGLDVSWQIAFQHAARDDLPFGSLLTYPYGPFGFLTTRTFVLAGPGALVVIVRCISWFALSCSAVVLLRRRFGTGGAVLVSILVLSLLRAGAQYTWIFLAPLVAAWIVASLDGRRRWTWGSAVGPAVVGAFLLLSKFDAGLAVIAAGLIGSTGRALLGDGRSAALRNLAVWGATLALSIPALWLSAGQSLGDLGSWFARSIEVARGYSTAMGQEQPTSTWEYLAVVAVAAALLGLVWSVRTLSRGYRLTITLVLAASLYPAFRSGFTRHPGRGQIFFLAAAIVVLGLSRALPRRQTAWLLVGTTVAFCAAAAVPLSYLGHLDSRTDTVEEAVELLTSRSARVERITRQQTLLREQYQVPASILQRIGRSPVHVTPWEIGVIYAYPQLRWAPLPVFQSYQAYTERLDEVNAAYLASGDRPRYLLNQPGLAIDGRLARFDPPGTMLETLCRYRVVTQEGGWQLLEAGRSRCGVARSVRTVTSYLGRATAVPEGGDDLVVARFSGLGTGLDERLETVLLRGPRYYVSSDAVSWNQLVLGTQSSWHVLRAPSCAQDQLRGSGPMFSSLVVSDERGAAARIGTYEVEFARIPFECPSGG